MPAIKKVNQATSSNALQGEKFRIVERAALVTLYASCVNAGDTASLSIGSTDLVLDAEPNIEISADVVDVDRDLILAREIVGPGELYLAVTATTAVNFLLMIEYIR